MAMTDTNPLGLDGIEFVEIAGPNPGAIARLLRDFGFSRLMRHGERAIDYWRQHDIHILHNDAVGSFSMEFQGLHGPCISAMGWRVDNAKALRFIRRLAISIEMNLVTSCQPGRERQAFQDGKRPADPEHLHRRQGRGLRRDGWLRRGAHVGLAAQGLPNALHRAELVGGLRMRGFLAGEIAGFQAFIE